MQAKKSKKTIDINFKFPITYNKFPDIYKKFLNYEVFGNILLEINSIVAFFRIMVSVVTESVSTSFHEVSSQSPTVTNASNYLQMTSKGFT